VEETLGNTGGRDVRRRDDAPTALEQHALEFLPADRVAEDERFADQFFDLDARHLDKAPVEKLL
jgi:hypothetical protein